MMVSIWTIVFVVLGAFWFAGMVWAYKWTRGMQVGWPKRILMICVWPILYLACLFTVVQ